MAQRSYSLNPRSYGQLLAAGISPHQIKEAINSGLDPSQLPPEYFGMSGGFTPQSVGPGASPSSNIGGIDIPPANMADPYGYAPSGGPGSTGVFGTTPNFGFGGNLGVGGYLPSGSTDYLGIPGAASNAGSMNLGGNPMGFSTPVTPDWWNLPSSYDYGWTAPDYGSYGGMNTGGYDISGFGGSPDFSYLPSSNDAYLGFGGTDTGGVGMQQDFTQSPADVFAGVQDPVGPFSEPGAILGDIPPPEGWVDGLPPLTPPDAIPEVPPDQQPPGTQDFPGQYSGPQAPPPDALQPGALPGLGTGVFASFGGPFSSPGFAGPLFSSTAIHGIGFDDYASQHPGGLTGLGAMNAPGGFMPTGIFSSPLDDPMGLRGFVGEGGDSQTRHGVDISDLRSSLPDPVIDPEYISGWNWQHGTGGGMQSINVHGYWSPVYSPGTGTNVVMPTSHHSGGHG